MRKCKVEIVPALNKLSTNERRRMEEWRCSLTIYNLDYSCTPQEDSPQYPLDTLGRTTGAGLTAVQ
jgi:hypothetical protein